MEKFLRKNSLKNIWIQPAAGDAGGSLGAPLYYWYDVLGNQREYGIDMMSGSYLGPSYNSDEIRKKLNNLGANDEEFSESDLLKLVAKELSNEKLLGGSRAKWNLVLDRWVQDQLLQIQDLIKCKKFESKSEI